MNNEILPRITQRVNTSAANRNAFALLANLANGATVRCARCRKLVDYEQIAVLRSKRLRAAIAFCWACAGGAV